jgi:hypothetical protein
MPLGATNILFDSLIEFSELSGQLANNSKHNRLEKPQVSHRNPPAAGTHTFPEWPSPQGATCLPPRSRTSSP